MKYISYLALTLIIVGALNWLLVGLFEFNLVDFLFGVGSILSKTIYVLVGIAGVWSLLFYKVVDK